MLLSAFFFAIEFALMGSCFGAYCRHLNHCIHLCCRPYLHFKMPFFFCYLPDLQSGIFSMSFLIIFIVLVLILPLNGGFVSYVFPLSVSGHLSDQ